MVTTLSNTMKKLFAGDRWQEDDLIFPPTVGTPQDPRNLYRNFQATLKQASLPRIRFHDLRHTAATLMLRQGINPKVVQEQLGHRDITLTLDTHSHVLPDIREEAIQKLDKVLAAKASDEKPHFLDLPADFGYAPQQREHE